MKKNTLLSIMNNQNGVTAIVVGVSLFALVGFAALAIDTSHIYVARNELKNAADAGALAGALVLYNNNGTAVNQDANQDAFNVATANESDGLAVEVNWTGGNTGDAQRGHWSFATGEFTPNDSLAPVDLWNVPSYYLDANPNFINAVRVVARREATPAGSFFARIFGHDGFQLSAESIAYRGFTGTLPPHEVDQPIAICEESIRIDGEYSCNIGRMISSGENEAGNETGGWTSFSQDDPCTGGTNAQEVSDLICGDGNPETLRHGAFMATNGGEIQSAFDKLITCWDEANEGRTEPWNLTLPVVSCSGNNMGPCEEYVGTVNVNIIWITEAGEDPQYRDVPTEMGDWECSDPDGGAACWDEFVDNFELLNADNASPAPYEKKTIYFLADCTYHDPAGASDGQNFGIMARIPVLVK